MLRFRYAGESHPGLVRSNNEDAGYAGPSLLLVADGVAGGAAGEVASASTAYVVTAVATMSDVVDPLELLSASALMAHEHLVQGCLDQPTRIGMSTTLTALLTDGERVGLAHVGDSRAYRWRPGDDTPLVPLTHDHTLVQALLDDGELTTEQAAAYPYRSVILRSMGADAPPEIDASWVEVNLGDRLLVCSDGLTDLVDEAHIADILEASATPADPDGHAVRDGDRDDLDRAVAALIAAALAAGGRDNVTCVLGEVVDGPRTQPFGTTLGAFSPPNLIDPTVVRMVHDGGPRRVRLQHDHREAG